MERKRNIEEIKEEIMFKYKKYGDVVKTAKSYGFTLYNVIFHDDGIGALINNIKDRSIMVNVESPLYCKQRMILYLLIDYLLYGDGLEVYANRYGQDDNVKEDVRKITEEILNS